VQARIDEHIAQATENLVTAPPDLPWMARAQGDIEGLRKAQQEISDMLKRYDDGGEDDSTTDGG
jgi:hypothetical protein